MFIYKSLTQPWAKKKQDNTSSLQLSGTFANNLINFCMSKNLFWWANVIFTLMFFCLCLPCGKKKIHYFLNLERRQTKHQGWKYHQSMNGQEFFTNCCEQTKYHGQNTFSIWFVPPTVFFSQDKVEKKKLAKTSIFFFSFILCLSIFFLSWKHFLSNKWKETLNRVHTILNTYVQHISIENAPPKKTVEHVCGVHEYKLYCWW